MEWYMVEGDEAEFAGHEFRVDQVLVRRAGHGSHKFWMGTSDEMRLRAKAKGGSGRGRKGKGKAKGRGGRGGCGRGDAVVAEDDIAPSDREERDSDSNEDLVESSCSDLGASDSAVSAVDGDDDEDDNIFGIPEEGLRDLRAEAVAEGAERGGAISGGSTPGSSESDSSSTYSSTSPDAPAPLVMPAVRVPLPGTDREGKLTVTNILGRQEIYATCGVRGHGSCILTRTTKIGRKKGQGRPVGFLAAWLQAGPTFGSKDAHMKHKPTFPERAAARRSLKTLPGVVDFFNMERLALEGEGSEPDEFH